MTVSPLQRTSALASIDAAHAALDEAQSIPPEFAPDGAVRAGLVSLARLEARAASMRGELLVEADRRELAAREAAASTSAWVAELTGTRQAVLAGGLWLATLLEEKYEPTRHAFAMGLIDHAQARVIVRAAEQMPVAATAEQRVLAEQTLVAKAAAGVDAGRLRHLARRMLERVDADLARRQETDMLAQEEQRAEFQAWMTLADAGDGTFVGRFAIPELHGHLLRNALEQLTGPRRLSQTASGEVVSDPTVPGENLSWTEKLGAGFLEILEHLPDAGHNPVGATLVIRLDYERLLDGLGGADLDGGVRISAAQARRLACDAGIVPLVLGGASQPLDIGRERRLHTKHQRLALAASHATCAVTGCERPFSWCEIHHPHAWAEGGATDVHNALPLCGFHHRRAHDDAFSLRRHPTGEWRFHRRT